MVGEKLEKLLQAKGMKAGTLAREIDVPKSTIYSIIKRNNKNVQYSVMEKIAKFLEVPVEYFYDTVDTNEAGAPIDYDEFTYAMHGHSGDLTDKDKEILLSMAAQLADANRKKAGNGPTIE